MVATPEAATDRLAVLAEAGFNPVDAKTAFGVLRYGSHKVVAVIDSTKAGQSTHSYLPGTDVPIVARLEEAISLGAEGLLIGIAPDGGQLPEDWRDLILTAISSGLDIHSGLHTFLSDDEELGAAAAKVGVAIVDYRRPPNDAAVAVGRAHSPGKRVILTVGSDCAIGKKTVALELDAAARHAGTSSVFVPTGQTGMMIAGWGVAVDRVASDFLNGTVEELVSEGERRGDWVWVEGQGSIDHPAYSAVTVGLVHGATPHAMVLVDKVGLTEHDFAHAPGRSFSIKPLNELVEAYELVASLVAPSQVVAIALNTSACDDRDARNAILAVTEATGLPCDDPVRFGTDHLWRQIQHRVEELPWVSQSA